MLNQDMLILAQERHATYYLEQLRDIATDYVQTSDKQSVINRFQLLWEQITFAREWAVANSHTPEIAQLCYEYIDAAEVLLNACQPYTETLRWLRDSLRTAEQWNERFYQIKALISIGEIELFHGGEPVEMCIERFNKAVALAKQIHQPYLEAKALMSLARAQYVLPKLALSALENFQHAKDILQELDFPYDFARVLQNLGMYEERYGDLSKALDYQNQALVIYKDLNRDQESAVVLSRLASIEERRANYPAAHEYAMKALTLARPTSDNRTIALCLSRLGLIVSIQGELELSRNYYMEALELSERIGDTRIKLTCLVNLGWLAREQRLYAEAIRYQTLVVQLAQEVNDVYSIASGYYQLADIYINTWMCGQAELNIHLSLNYAREIGATDVIISSLLLLGLLNVREGSIEDCGKILGAILNHPDINDPQLDAMLQQLQTEFAIACPSKLKQQSLINTGNTLGYEYFLEHFLKATS